MKLALVLFNYFPYGGLERDMLALAHACAARHQVVIYTQSWHGDKPVNIPVIELPVRALTNHGRAAAFVKKFQPRVEQEKIDLVIGFNKMPGLDFYYAADVCFAKKVYEERSWWYRLSSRSRHFLAMERAVFDAQSQTKILIIAPDQMTVFQRYYQTPSYRMHLLSPGIKRDRVMPDSYPSQRLQSRQQFGLKPDDNVMLMVGSDFRRKGVARSVAALAALPEALRARSQLWIAGLDKPDAIVALARDLGVSEKVKILGARDDIPQLMWAADIFLHPAHTEAAGAVLLEAMVAGLPVIATAVCGYAYFIDQWQMGLVLTTTEADSGLALAIEKITAQDAAQWRSRGRAFAERADIFSMTDHALKLIESAEHAL
jgi:UDP-glucose:(heptosyl)LPS alpha-1,3-glucosyltransferase